MGQMFIQTAVEIIAENIIGWIVSIVVILIGAFGVWALKKIGKRAGLEGISIATDEVIKMAIITVGELQQTIVNDLKANAADGKLTKEEIIMLSEKLVEKTLEKMSQPVYNLLNAAGTDIIALIKGAGEDWINSLKSEE